VTKTQHSENNLLDFITNEKLFAIIDQFITKITTSESKYNFYKNVIDPFSALFDAAITGISLEQWLLFETKRQKTLQNVIGEFHEEIIGGVSDWERLPVGNLVDVKCEK